MLNYNNKYRESAEKITSKSYSKPKYAEKSSHTSSINLKNINYNETVKTPLKSIINQKTSRQHINYKQDITLSRRLLTEHTQQSEKPQPLQHHKDKSKENKMTASYLCKEEGTKSPHIRGSFLDNNLSRSIINTERSKKTQRQGNTMDKIDKRIKTLLDESSSKASHRPSQCKKSPFQKTSELKRVDLYQKKRNEHNLVANEEDEWMKCRVSTKNTVNTNNSTQGIRISNQQLAKLVQDYWQLQSQLRRDQKELQLYRHELKTVQNSVISALM